MIYLLPFFSENEEIMHLYFFVEHSSQLSRADHKGNVLYHNWHTEKRYVLLKKRPLAVYRRIGPRRRIHPRWGFIFPRKRPPRSIGDLWGPSFVQTAEERL